MSKPPSPAKVVHPSVLLHAKELGAERACDGALPPEPYRVFASKPTPALGIGASVRSFEVRFAYVGATALTVVGPVSGQRYRFERPFAQLTVDPRDRPGLARIPSLRALPPA